MHRLGALFSVGLLALAAPGRPIPEASDDEVRIERIPPPKALPPDIRAVLSAESVRVRLAGRDFARLWMVRRITEANDRSSGSPFYSQRLNYLIAAGSLVGAIELPMSWSDYRGQPIAAGLYALHYAAQPIMKEHQGVSEFRDFLLLVRPGDSKVNGIGFTALAAASQRAAGTGHPAVLALFPAARDAPLPCLVRRERGLCILEVMAGNLAIGMVLAGRGHQTAINMSELSLLWSEL